MCLPDTGAQLCVVGLNVVYGLGLRKRDLFKVKTRVSAANNGRLNVLGGVFLTLTIQEEATHQLCYVAEEANCLFLRVFQDSRFSLKKKAEPTKHKPGGHIERIQKDF